MGRTIKRLFFLHRVWRTFFAPLISIFSLQNSLKQMRINWNRKDSMTTFWSSCEFTNEKVYSEWYLKQEFWMNWTHTYDINFKPSPKNNKLTIGGSTLLLSQEISSFDNHPQRTDMVGCSKSCSHTCQSSGRWETWKLRSYYRLRKVVPR